MCTSTVCSRTHLIVLLSARRHAVCYMRPSRSRISGLRSFSFVYSDPNAQTLSLRFVVHQNLILHLDSPYKMVAEKEKKNKENLTKLNYD